MVVVLVEIVLIIIQLFIVLLIVQAVISWLVAFDMISRRSPIVDTLWRFTNALTNPLLKPIRRVIPPVSGVDLAPLVLILALYALSRLIPIVVLGTG